MRLNKKIMSLLVVLLATVQAYAFGDIRQEARFLTDKMMYELNLSSRQYGDVYEINYDFLYSVAPLRVEIAYGNSRAIDQYYQLLNYRNQDLSWVMSANVYRRYTSLDYFYRPVYVTGGQINLRIYVNYSNRNHYYYRAPVNYGSYRGRFHRRGGDHYYYRTRYNAPRNTSYRAISSSNRKTRNYRNEDFGRRDTRTNHQTRDTRNNRNSSSNTRNVTNSRDRRTENRSSVSNSTRPSTRETTSRRSNDLRTNNQSNRRSTTNMSNNSNTRRSENTNSSSSSRRVDRSSNSRGNTTRSRNSAESRTTTPSREKSSSVNSRSNRNSRESSGSSRSTRSTRSRETRTDSRIRAV